MDPRLLLLAFVAMFVVVTTPFAYRRMKRERNLEWERRWTQLPLAERWRLIRQARRGITPADPAEAELVAGSARYQRSVRRSVSYRGIVRLVVASILLLAAIAEGSVLLIGLALAFLGFVAWLGRRDRALDRRLASAEDLDAGVRS
jgi:hypothetical protein